MLKQLMEERANLIKQMRDMVETAEKENRDFSAEETEKYEKINSRIDQIKDKIDKLKRIEELEAESQQVIHSAENLPGKEDYDGREAKEAEHKDSRATTSPQQRAKDFAVAIQGWARASNGMSLEDEHIQAMQRVGISPSQAEIEIRLAGDYGLVKREARAMSTSDGSGGEFIPEGLVRTIETALLYYAPLRNYATVMRTATGNTLVWPTVNDTGNKGELLAENTAAATQDIATSSISLGAYKISSKFVKVSNELLTDSAFNLINYIGTAIGERIARKQVELFTTGTGSSQPQGIVTGATAGKTAASATAITFDEVLDLIYSVDAAYRQRAAFMANDAVILALRKLKDSNGQYIWQPSGQAGEPDRLSGYPVIFNNEMADTIEASAKTLIFGAINKYIIRDVQTLTLRRLNERFADYDQVGFIGFMRSDGKVLDAGTHPIKYLQQAAS